MMKLLRSGLLLCLLLWSVRLSAGVPDTLRVGVADTLRLYSADTITIIRTDDTLHVASGDTLVVTGPGEPTAAVPPDTLVIAGVGDIMLGTDYPSERYLPPGKDCIPLMQEVKLWLEEADVAAGNLEGTFAGKCGEPKFCRDTLNCYVFRMPEEFVHCLVDAGFDLISVANNHSNDFGLAGRENTEKVLTEAGLAWAGFDHVPCTVWEKDSVRYGFCAFSTSAGTPLIQDLKTAASLVARMDSLSDVVIVSFHGGAEGKDHEHVPRTTEEFLGTDRGDVYAFAHAVVDAGADVVFGHGPHVTRSVDLYRDRFIIYSLGNFCTWGRFNLRGPNGIAPIVRVKVNRRGEFLEAQVVPVYQPGWIGTFPDPGKRVIRKLQELLEQDFPEVPLMIDEEGMIRKTGG